MMASINLILFFTTVTLMGLQLLPIFIDKRKILNILVVLYTLKALLYFIDGEWGFGLIDLTLAGFWVLISYSNKKKLPISDPNFKK